MDFLFMAFNDQYIYFQGPIGTAKIQVLLTMLCYTGRKSHQISKPVLQMPCSHEHVKITYGKDFL